MRDVSIHQVDEEGATVQLTLTPTDDVLTLDLDADRIGLSFDLDSGHAEVLHDLLGRWLCRRRQALREAAR